MIVLYVIIGLVLVSSPFWIKNIVNEKRNKKMAITKQNTEQQEQQKAYEEKQRQENEIKLHTLLQNSNTTLDRYEQQIANGQDKYQIGRAIGRLCAEFQTELEKLYGVDKSNADVFIKRVDDILNNDIQLENGAVDFQSEQKQIIAQKQQTQISMQNSAQKMDRITKTFSGAPELVSSAIESFIKKHPDYVLIFQSPFTKSVNSVWTKGIGITVVQCTITLERKN